ncbi:DegT/DnrJ/EryC1/StrS family aminotransferase [Vibrio sp.]|uniref:DegT/DnrJ/EryC1/StrS family aminotransferase n=1 Tax=Vibrio sp. TaxID=678 RepID=UPI0031204E26
MHFIDLAAQYHSLKDKIDYRIRSVLEHGQFIMGPEVTELETRLAKFVGVEHVVTCANGTDALQLALMALGVGDGDAVFCPSFTFFASAEAIAFCKAEPVFVDSDEKTYNICPQDLERRIEDVIFQGRLTPKAIMAVDLFGLPADYKAIKKVADKYGLKIIEDAAQGFGGTIDGQLAGSFGDISTTSFFPAKPLGCYGDGGAVFTNNAEYAELLRSYRIHGKGSDKYDNVRIGMNSRLDTIQAAILLAKLEAFPSELVSRQQAAERYNEQLKGSYELPFIPEGYTSSWAQYTVCSNDRTKAMKEFADSGVPTMVYYRTCMHQQTAFAHLGYKQGDFPVAEKLSGQVFSLPMHGYLDKGHG